MDYPPNQPSSSSPSSSFCHGHLANVSITSSPMSSTDMLSFNHNIPPIIFCCSDRDVNSEIQYTIPTNTINLVSNLDNETVGSSERKQIKVPCNKKTLKQSLIYRKNKPQQLYSYLKQHQQQQQSNKKSQMTMISPQNQKFVFHSNQQSTLNISQTELSSGLNSSSNFIPIIHELSKPSTSKSISKLSNYGQSLLVKSVSKHTLDEDVLMTDGSVLEKITNKRIKRKNEDSLLVRSMPKSDLNDLLNSVPNSESTSIDVLDFVFTPKSSSSNVQKEKIDLSYSENVCQTYDQKNEMNTPLILQIFNSGTNIELFEINSDSEKYDKKFLFFGENIKVHQEPKKGIEEEIEEEKEEIREKENEEEEEEIGEKEDEDIGKEKIERKPQKIKERKKSKKEKIKCIKKPETEIEVEIHQVNDFKETKGARDILLKIRKINRILDKDNKIRMLLKKKRIAKKQINYVKVKDDETNLKINKRNVSMRMSRTLRTMSREEVKRIEQRLRELQQKFILKAISYENKIFSKQIITDKDAKDILSILLQLSIIEFRNISINETENFRKFVGIIKEKLESFYTEMNLDNDLDEPTDCDKDNAFEVKSNYFKISTKNRLSTESFSILAKRVVKLQNDIDFSKDFIQRKKLKEDLFKTFIDLEISRIEAMFENLNKKIMIIKSLDIRKKFIKELNIFQAKIQNSIDHILMNSNKNFNIFQTKCQEIIGALQKFSRKVYYQHKNIERNCSFVKSEISYKEINTENDAKTELIDFENSKMDQIIKCLIASSKIHTLTQIEQEKHLKIREILLELSKNDLTLKGIQKDFRKEELLINYKNKLIDKYKMKPLNNQSKNFNQGKLEEGCLIIPSNKEKLLLYKMMKNNQLNMDWFLRFSQKIDFCPSFKGQFRKKNCEEKNFERKNQLFQKIIRGLSFIPKFCSIEEESLKKNHITNIIKRMIMKKNDTKKIPEIDNNIENNIENCKKIKEKEQLLKNKIFTLYIEQFRLKLIAELISISNSKDKQFSEKQIAFLTEQVNFETKIKQIFHQILNMIIDMKKHKKNQMYCLRIFHNMKNEFLTFHRENNWMIFENEKKNDSEDLSDMREFLPSLSQHFRNVYLNSIKVSSNKQKQKNEQHFDEVESVYRNVKNEEKYSEECLKQKSITNEKSLIRGFIKTDEPAFCVQIERLLIKKALCRARIPFNPYLFPGILVPNAKFERQSAFFDRSIPLVPCVHSSLFLKMVNYQNLLDREHLIFLCSNEADSIRPELLFCYEKSCVQETEQKPNNLLICLTCGGFFCFDKHHGHAHFEQSHHTFALSITNSFVFCFLCDKFIFDYDLDPTVKLIRESLVPIWKQNLIYHWEKGLWHYSTGEYYPELKLFRLNFSHTKLGLIGLFNLGSTCFMNSIIHTLVHAAGFREYLLTQSHRCPESKFQYCIGCEFSQMAHQLYFGSRFPVIPARFYDLVWVHIPHLAFYSEHDAHEFFTSFLDVLHEHYRGDTSGNCDCIVHKLFYGILQSELTCQTCGTIRKNDEVMMGFNLDLKDQSFRPAKNLQTLEDCLNLFTKLEDLGPDMLLTCDSCDNRRQTSKRMKIKYLPPIIGFQFKRFEQIGFKSLKISHKVSYELNMDLGPFVDGASKCDPDYQYTLYAVVNHIGSLHSGHYTASIRSDDNRWYLFNDEYVEKITQNAVLDNINAYMVFYRKKNMAKKLHNGEMLC